MAERRPPGFNVDLGFYDSDEVLSIPRKIRAAAIGVWTLAGCFSANKLSDGYVSAEALRDRGCTPAIRAALMATTKADGSPSPLWIDAGEGAIQFTRWAKWQRTAEEIKAYREAEADRKRKEREAKKAARETRRAASAGLLQADVDATCGSRGDHVATTWRPGEQYVASDINATSAPRNDSAPLSTSGNGKTSGRTSAGHPPGVRPEDGDPKTETETETEIKNSGHLLESATDSTGRGSVAATPGADLVRSVIPKNHPAAVQTGLRMQASALINAGTPRAIVEAALRLWLTKTGVGPGVLPSLVSDVIKAESPRPHTNGLTPGEAKVAGWAQLGSPTVTQEAIER